MNKLAMDNINKISFYEICDKGAFLLLCILMMDCCIFGAGRILVFGHISFRMAVVGMFILCSLPIVLLDIKRIIRNPYFWLLCMFYIWLFISLIIGLCNNNSISIIISDIKGFAYFSVLPGIICILSNIRRVEFLMKIMMYASMALAIITITLLIICIAGFSGLEAFAIKCHEVGFCTITNVAPLMPRLFFYSGLYLICGCAFSTYFQVTKPQTRYCFIYTFISGVCLFAVLVSYTRSVYLGVLVAALGVILAIVISKISIKTLFRHVFFSIIVVLILVIIFHVITNNNYLVYSISRTFSIEFESAYSEKAQEYNEITVDSDGDRTMTIEEYYENIKNAPIFGNGLGKALECRHDGLGEYFYLDIWSKMGVLGLLLYLAPIIKMLSILIKMIRMKSKLVATNCVWVATLIGFMAFSYFNPYMNAALGILYYCCSIGVVNTLEKDLY